MLEWTLLIVLTVLVSFLSLKPSQPKRPAFTTVKKYEPLQLPAEQQSLYEALMDKGYYVSCGLQEKRVTIPLALEPFRIAFIPQEDSKLKHLSISIYLKMKGWHIIPFAAKYEQEEWKTVLSEVENNQFPGYKKMKKVQ